MSFQTLEQIKDLLPILTVADRIELKTALQRIVQDRSHLLALPAETITLIASDLEPNDFCNFRLVNRAVAAKTILCLRDRVSNLRFLPSQKESLDALSKLVSTDIKPL